MLQAYRAFVETFFVSSYTLLHPISFSFKDNEPRTCLTFFFFFPFSSMHYNSFLLFIALILSLSIIFRLMLIFNQILFYIYVHVHTRVSFLRKKYDREYVITLNSLIFFALTFFSNLNIERKLYSGTVSHILYRYRKSIQADRKIEFWSIRLEHSNSILSL